MLLNAVFVTSVLSLLAVTKATPVQVAPRSYASAGLECYFTCPTVEGAQLSSSTADAGTNSITGRQFAQCAYSYSGIEYCEYYNDDGTLEGTNSFCPAQAPLAGCGPQYAPSGTNLYNFKRSMIPREKRETAAQRRIRNLQYDPKRHS